MRSSPSGSAPVLRCSRCGDACIHDGSVGVSEGLSHGRVDTAAFMVADEGPSKAPIDKGVFEGAAGLLKSTR